MTFSRYRIVRLTFFLLIAFLIGTNVSSANDIEVTNVSLTGQNTSEGYVNVRFDLSWENSWRLNDGPSNWDAAWVFVKYRVEGSSDWHHAFLNNSGHNSGSGTSALVQTGLIHEDQSFDMTDNPGMGAFFFRSIAGSGTFSVNDAQLRWNYTANGVGDTDVVDVQVFAIEMIYIPEGSFYLGDGQTDGHQFYAGNDPGTPFQVTSDGPIPVGEGEGELFYESGSGIINELAFDQEGPIPAAFPNGYAGFYIMKHHVTQQQMADYLNNLTQEQAEARYRSDFWSFWPFENAHNRNLMDIENGIYVTQAPFVPIHHISVQDPYAYAGWSGTRVMTEMEFEKAARGPLFPVEGEYAWGNTSIAVEQYSFENMDQADERVVENYQENVGNAYYSSTNRPVPIGDTESLGPARVGIFATSSSNRVQAGASYYGVLDMTGNVEDYVVLAGNADGRLVTGEHGNGTLTEDGRMTFSYSIPDFALTKGGQFRFGGSIREVSYRNRIEISMEDTPTFDSESEGMGFRVVRSAPSLPAE